MFLTFLSCSAAAPEAFQPEVAAEVVEGGRADVEAALDRLLAADPERTPGEERRAMAAEIESRLLLDPVLAEHREINEELRILALCYAAAGKDSLPRLRSEIDAARIEWRRRLSDRLSDQEESR